MILSHRHKFIFLKTRKTAGTSLEIGLSEHCGPDDVITEVMPEDEALRQEKGFRGPQNQDRIKGPQGRRLRNHDGAGLVRAAVGSDVWQEYFKFTVERNPFDKAISRYWWNTRNEHDRPDIGSFLQSCPTHLLSNWDIYAIEDRVAVDCVIRFETLREDVKAIEARLRIPPVTLVRAKSSHRPDRRPYQQVLGPADRRRIEQVCAREIARFGYDWSYLMP